MAVGGIFRRPALRSVALCAILVATALTHASPSLGRGADEPGVIVDFSAIDEAVALRRVWSQARPDPQRYAIPDPAMLRGAASVPPHAEELPPAVALPQSEVPPAPQPGSADFYAAFPPPPPVPADAPVGGAAPADAGDQGASVLPLSPISAVAALPVARPAAPMRARFAAPTPRRPSLRPASTAVLPSAVLPVRRASRYGLEPARIQVAPARPVRPQGSDEFGRRVRLRLPYPVFGTDLTPSAQAELEALAADVRPNDRLRFRLAAYANAGAGSPGKARRTSLARALSVRSFLIERGIKASRIDLRALGNTAGAAEADRVDVVVSDK